MKRSNGREWLSFNIPTTNRKNNTCRRIQTSPAQHFARAKWYVNDVTLIFVHEHVDAINKTMVAALQYVFTSLIFSWVFICGSSISWDYPFKTCKDVLTCGFHLCFIFWRVKSNIIIFGTSIFMPLNAFSPNYACSSCTIFPVMD